MCIIILDDRPNTDRLSKDIFERARDVNPDGLGIMHPAGNGKIKIWRSMTDVDELWKRYCSARDESARVAVHFRLTTKGTTSLNNCHPIKIAPDLAIMHNGTISCLTPILPDGVSDTRLLVSGLLKKFKTNKTYIYNDDVLSAVITNLLGTDRLLFMNGKGGYMIYGSSSLGAQWYPKIGESKLGNGVWFSKGRELDYIVEGKPRAASIFPSYGKYFNHGWGDHWDRPKTKSITPKSKIDNNLVFDYGTFEWLGMKSPLYDILDKGAVLENAALHAVEGTYKGMPICTPDDGSMTKGTIYAIPGTRGNVNNELNGIDAVHGCDFSDPGGSWYFREKKTITLRTGGTVQAWVYYHGLSPDDYDDDIYRIPFGDWSAYMPDNTDDADDIEMEDSPPFVLLDSPEPITKPGHYGCPGCTSKNTYVCTVYPAANSGKEITDYLVCDNCETESPFQKEAQA